MAHMRGMLGDCVALVSGSYPAFQLDPRALCKLIEAHICYQATDITSLHKSFSRFGLHGASMISSHRSSLCARRLE
jgi:hypothetical protein